jgi:hypothetical protein
MIREFFYDKRTNRFRYSDTGRFAPREAILNLSKKNIKSAENQLVVLTDLLMDGRMRLDDWQRSVGSLIKTLHIENLLLGKGGINNTFANDYLSAGRELKKEYQYLKDFAQDIKDGTVSKSQALSRVKMYGRKSKLGYWLGLDVSNANKKYMRRILAPVEHCPECLQYGSMGWQLKGTLPLPTQACSCRSNCRCTVVYADSLPQGQTITDRNSVV